MYVYIHIIIIFRYSRNSSCTFAVTCVHQYSIG